MVDGVGMSVGATTLAAVVVGRAAVTRSPVLTRFPHRPPEVGVPSENRNLNEPGLILTDFVDRVGDPVGIVAADGTTHRADVVLAEALRALLLTVGGGRPPAGPVAITHPAHWRPAAVEALRGAVTALPELRRAVLLSDAEAALTALQTEPGLPGRGVIALCDFGGTGTSITLVDAGRNYLPIAETVRHPDLSGDLLDQALLTHVIDDLSAAGTIDLSGTSAIGSLSRLRAQCRGAKERLSTATFTSLVAELPGHRSDVRLTRTELDDVLRAPLNQFVDVVQDTLQRNGVHQLAAIATVGGGARIPLITTTLSERFRLPVVTIAQPELAAAIGGGLAATRGSVEDGATAMSPAADVTAAHPDVAAAPTAMAPAAEPPPSEAALAWSAADDVPDVVPPADGRPEVSFGDDAAQHEEDDDWDNVPPRAPVPWYRNPLVPLGSGIVLAILLLLVAVVWVLAGDESPPSPTPASTTAPPMTFSQVPREPEPAPEAPAPATQAPAPVNPPPVTQTVTAEPPPAQEPPAEQPPAEEPPAEEPPAEQPPAEEPPAEEPEEPKPPVWTPPTWSPTPPYSTVPGLPWVPAPPGFPSQP